MKSVFYLLSVLPVLTTSAFGATRCESLVRDASYRQGPALGAPKEGMIDYKAINQILLGLRRAVVQSHPLPEGFRAETLAPTEGGPPVAGVALTGILSGPHVLTGREISVIVQRQGLALVVTISVGSDTLYERALAHDEFAEVFPYRPPPGQGALLSVIHGIETNSSLDGWTELSSLGQDTNAKNPY